MEKSIKILSIEAKDIFSSMNNVVGNVGYSIRGSDGQIRLSKFTNAYDYSIDMIKLEDVYRKKYRNNWFSFRAGRHLYTKQIINVTFKYSAKIYNQSGQNTYIKFGYNYRDCDFTDGVCVRDGDLIGIQTNVEVKEPISQELLGEYFTYVNGHYEQVKTPETIMDRSALREHLYDNGFICDGIEYVRYKRSAGASRVGKCLFINKELYGEMSAWDKCGLNIKDGDEIDLASYEAYLALPLSSIIDTIHIPLESMLVIDDYESIFKDEVVAVGIENERLVSEQKEVSITNSIFDGQSLMDKSLFGEYEDKGMLLLRNRFFKSCCFNTNIQEWFKDNDITDVKQLNGFTMATDISQVKFITTPSSIKFLKFGNIEDWFKVIDPMFGVVKYEKPPRSFDGRMVQAHYQLFNTLQLTYDEMQEVLQPTLNYIAAIRRDPAVLRHKIQMPEEIEDGEWSALDMKNDIIFKLLGINDKFAHTKLYYDFRDDLIKSEIRSLRRGHVLVRGNYSTLMGNGLEMLQASIGQFSGQSILGYGNVHSKRFEYNKTILCSRSPHVTVGNILLVQNVASELHDKYFNATPEIVFINSIGENILQRLNGADFDSDTMLMTDNELLIEVAKRNYDKFRVPTNLTTSVKIKRYYTQSDKADLDIKTSVNKIGEIINLSQQLNSIMWDKINRGKSVESCKDLYLDICKLAVLSNVEIDRAKKEFVINSATEIDILKRKYKIADDERTVKPAFFKMITLENGYELSDKIKYKYFETSMDYLQKIISRFNFREGREQKRSVTPFMSMIKEPPHHRQGHFYSRRDIIIQKIREAKNECRKIYSNYESMTRDEKEYARSCAFEVKQDCINEIDKMSNCPSVMYLTLKELDNPEFRDVARFTFDVLFGKPNQAFFTLVKESVEDVYTLVEDVDGDIEYFGYKFTKTPLKRSEAISQSAIQSE